ncbi:MAG: NAD(P)/FAD-dependent oxidoreductase, partial [Eggerthellaceae bacterium]|nr:NAD(P)/FAD-dependent oxidoreductase [Eggerthellaceae bacterium]
DLGIEPDTWIVQFPVLGPIALDSPYPKYLDNIRIRGELKLVRKNSLVAKEDGEVLFRKYGISGIAAFNLSRLIRRNDIIVLDLFPKMASSDLAEFLKGRAKQLGYYLHRDATYADMLKGIVLERVSDVMLEAVSLSPDAPFETSNAELLAAALKSLTFDVTGIGDPTHCQIPSSMASKEQPGLYVVGEAVDIDAPCGGYNLHWAWASGLLAGKRAVEKFLD